MSDTKTYAMNCIDAMVQKILYLQQTLAEIEDTSATLWEHLRQIKEDLKLE